MFETVNMKKKYFAQILYRVYDRFHTKLHERRFTGSLVTTIISKATCKYNFAQLPCSSSFTLNAKSQYQVTFE
jgi:hypothetical protein